MVDGYLEHHRKDKGSDDRMILEVFVSDTGNKRIQAIDLEGDFVRSITDNTMNSPTAMATDNQIIFVLDRSQRKVFLFNIQGELLYGIDNNLDDPRDIYFLLRL